MSEQLAGILQTLAPTQPDVPLGAHEPSPLDLLAALHDEAAETTRLANLLGRTPRFAAALGAGAIATYAYKAGWPILAAPALWALLVLCGAALLTQLYALALRAPFALPALRAFSTSMNGVLLYAGCAWGAGLFFVGTEYNILIALAFSAGMPALADLVLRDPATTRHFTIPAVLMSSVAVALGPLGVPAALLVTVAGTCVIAAAEVAARLSAARFRPALFSVS